MVDVGAIIRDNEVFARVQGKNSPDVMEEVPSSS